MVTATTTTIGSLVTRNREGESWDSIAHELGLARATLICRIKSALGITRWCQLPKSAPASTKRILVD